MLSTRAPLLLCGSCTQNVSCVCHQLATGPGASLRDQMANQGASLCPYMLRTTANGGKYPLKLCNYCQPQPVGKNLRIQIKMAFCRLLPLRHRPPSPWKANRKVGAEEKQHPTKEIIKCSGCRGETVGNSTAGPAAVHGFGGQECLRANIQEVCLGWPKKRKRGRLKM